MNRAVVTALAGALISGCQPSYVKELPAGAAVSDAPVNLASLNPKMVLLSSFLIDVPTGTALGEQSGGWGGRCSYKEPLTFRSTRQPEPKFYQDTFKEVMERAGVPVQPVQRFEGEDVRKADLHFAAVIRNMTMNICYPRMDTERHFAQGEVWVEIEWSLFSPLEKAVVYTSVGTGRTPAAFESNLGEVGLIREAFRSALVQLLNEPKFTAVLSKATKPGAAVAEKVLRVHQPPPRTGRIQQQIDEVRASVVTVHTNHGSGSGFAIGRGEYVVTAAHVVSGTSYVKVLGAKDQQAYGEVIRKNLPRDVALIKLEKPLFKPLHLMRGVLKEGAEIYAIGSPLGKDFERSVTKGIVSGIRRIDELEYIQSDVSILPGNSGGPLLDGQGNVVGISSSGMAVNGAPAGMNFFVPARDVFPALSLEVEATAK